MKRYLVPPHRPQHFVNPEGFLSASQPNGNYDIPDWHEPGLLPRPITPPPDDKIMLRPEAIISRKPFDRDDCSSASSRGSLPERMLRADRMMKDPSALSSQRHPLIDAALNIYTSQLHRASNYFLGQDAASTKRPTQWNRLCSLVPANFFVYRQRPPLAENHAESARFIAWLVEKNFLKHDPEHPQEGWGIANTILTEHSIRAASRADGFEHGLLTPHKLLMATVALNAAYDAGRFEFFEMKDIYGFALNNDAKPDTHFRMPETTKEACQNRAGGGRVTPAMIETRKRQVKERKQTVSAEVKRYTDEKLKAQSSNLI